MAGEGNIEVDGDLENETVTGGGDPEAVERASPNKGSVGRVDEPDELEEDDGLEFKIDDRPQDDEGDDLSVEPTSATEEDDEDDGSAKYSKSVRKRIEREQRLKQQAREEAARLAAENAELRRRVFDSDRKAKAAEIDGKIAAAEEKVRQAKADLDVDTELAAMREMARLEGQKAALMASAVEGDGAGGAGRQPPPNPERARLVGEWRDRNPWFGKNQVLTKRALEINKSLVDSGYDDEDPAFYRELTRRLRDQGARREPGRDRDARDRSATNRSPVDTGRSSAASAPGARRTVVSLTRDDQANMRAFGLDPTNAAHVKSYAIQKQRG